MINREKEPRKIKSKYIYTHNITFISFVISNHVLDVKYIPLEPFDVIFTFYPQLSRNNILAWQFTFDSNPATCSFAHASKPESTYIDSPVIRLNNTCAIFLWPACIKQYAIIDDEETRSYMWYIIDIPAAIICTSV